jgi:hypothetical protein
MARLMADVSFRRSQEADRYAAHVRPVNELVDALRDLDDRGWMPHVAPLHGGVDAQLLSVLRDPGPKVQEGIGSGFLCIENDDPTAERQANAFKAIGIEAADITPWNAYPWYVNRKPTATELAAGVDPLLRLVALMPKLRVVLLQGGDARNVWQRLLKRHPDIAQDRDITVIATYHPGRQALWSSDPVVRQARHEARVDAYRRAAEVLHRS